MTYIKYTSGLFILFLAVVSVSLAQNINPDTVKKVKAYLDQMEKIG